MNRTSKDKLTYSLQNLEGAVCISVAGEIDAKNAFGLTAHLRMAAQNHDSTMIVDLRDLRSMEATGVNVLLEAQRRLAYSGRMIVLAGPSPSIRKILRVLNVGDIMPIFGSVEEALTYLRAATSEDEERPSAGS